MKAYKIRKSGGTNIVTVPQYVLDTGLTEIEWKVNPKRNMIEIPLPFSLKEAYAGCPNRHDLKVMESFLQQTPKIRKEELYRLFKRKYRDNVILPHFNKAYSTLLELGRIREKGNFVFYYNYVE